MSTHKMWIGMDLGIGPDRTFLSIVDSGSLVGPFEISDKPVSFQRLASNGLSLGRITIHKDNLYQALEQQMERSEKYRAVIHTPIFEGLASKEVAICLQELTLSHPETTFLVNANEGGRITVRAMPTFLPEGYGDDFIEERKAINARLADELKTIERSFAPAESGEKRG